MGYFRLVYLPLTLVAITECICICYNSVCSHSKVSTYLSTQISLVGDSWHQSALPSLQFGLLGNCSIIFSAASFISDPGQVDVSVRIYGHFLSRCFFTLSRSVPRYSKQAHFDTSERFGAGKADASFGPNGHYRWKRRGKDTFDENTHGYEWGFAGYTEETRCQSLPNPCRGTAKISAFPGLHTFARRYVTLIERPPASFHAPLQLPLGYSKTQNFS